MSLERTYRSVVHLFYYERLTVSQTAKALSISESAVKKRLERARQRLKDILGGDFSE
jgi:RNA polymerase sigma-70 factor (ECF subfamily)